jgi:outer membrane protein
MKRLAIVVFVMFISTAVCAQTFPKPNYFEQFFVKARPAQKLPSPEGLDQFIQNGKLHLSLTDAIRLTLANNTSVQINSLQINTSRNSLLRSYSPFDPVITTSYNPARSTSPTTSTLQGANTLSSLNQPFNSTYAQLFGTGTTYQVTMSANKSANNSSFATFNPSISSALTVSISQPLLRNRGWFLTRAPISIAQRNFKISRAGFESSVNDAMLSAVNEYWNVVQAKQNVEVLRQSLTLAEASYQHDKRALELGALSPLDIYRSEAQVAQRKVSVIQAEYQLKQTEDSFRQTIGADLDPRMAALDLDLYESVELGTETPTPDASHVIEQALQSRPEMTALDEQSGIDDISLRVAANGLKPDLTIGSFYSTTGVGGNQLTTANGSPVVVAQGGLLDSLDQLGSLGFPGYGLSVQLRLPLRNRAAQADMGNALVNQRRTMYQRRLREQTITLEARNAVHQLEQAKLTVAAGKLARDLAQKQLQAEQRKYELGAETIFFVLDAQNQLSQAEQSLVQAQIGYQRALATLDRVSGDLLKRFNVEITHQEP